MGELIDLSAGSARCRVSPSFGATVVALHLESPTENAASVPNLLWMPAGEISSPGWPGGGMPILFPFAGRVWSQSQVGRYDWDGHTYHLPIHGFACGEAWRAVEQRIDRVTLELASSEQTRIHYPFDFLLRVEYQLTRFSLSTRLTITHKESSSASASAMPVAAGLHPYFRLPLQPEIKSFARCNLQIAAQQMIRVTPTGDAGDKLGSAASSLLPLDNPSFHNLILGSVEGGVAQLIDERSKVALSLDFGRGGPFQYVVLWGKEDQGFFCVEPWMGLPNAPKRTGQSGGCTLIKKGQTLGLTFSIARL